MRYAAIIDGTLGTAERQARALAGFLGDGLRGDPSGGFPGETVIFYHDGGDRERLVALAPTPAVRLVRTAARRPDRIAERISGAAVDGHIGLYLFAAGLAGTEAATRLAARTGGSVFTDALSIDVTPDAILGRRNVYSGHMVGTFELPAHPCCVALDACWNDAPHPATIEHRVVSDTDETANADPEPFTDVEITAPPPTGDLASGRFLVVAGRGAGSRAAVERIAAAAARMGAAFGASRPVVMNAWAPMDRLVGVSGTRTAPDLCVVVGASGAPALHWGIERAACIVAVNTDGDAAIVGNADVAVLDDGVTVIEELAEILTREKGDASGA